MEGEDSHIIIMGILNKLLECSSPAESTLHLLTQMKPSKMGFVFIIVMFNHFPTLHSSLMYNI